jgi:hypothetical protein
MTETQQKNYYAKKEFAQAISELLGYKFSEADIDKMRKLGKLKAVLLGSSPRWKYPKEELVKEKFITE